jgi:hypothetical protein
MSIVSVWTLRPDFQQGPRPNGGGAVSRRVEAVERYDDWPSEPTPTAWCSGGPSPAQRGRGFNGVSKLKPVAGSRATAFPERSP